MKFFEAIKSFNRWKNFEVKQLTATGYLSDLRIFCLTLHNPEIETIGLEDVLKHFEEMRSLEWGESNFPRKVQALKSFFAFFRKQGYKVLDPDLIPKAQKDFKLPRIAEKENYQKLIESISHDNAPRNIRNMAMINLLWDTGARNSEICDLQVTDLDLKEMKAVIKTKKNKGIRPFRELFWTQATNNNLERWLVTRDILQVTGQMLNLDKPVKLDDPQTLFFSLNHAGAGKKINNKVFGSILRRQSIEAGIETMNAHSFRHHMGHQIVNKGGSNSDVSNILGHSSLESSYVYTMMSNKALQERHKKFVE